jgi:hypothetical protein
LPILQLLFASDRISRRFELLHVNEVKHTVFFDEFRAATAAVLIGLIRRLLVTPM